MWLVGSRAQAQLLWCTGLVALQHVGSSRTRDQTCVPCIGRRILNHGATREDQICDIILSIGTGKSLVMHEYIIQLLILEMSHFFFSSHALYVKSRGTDHLRSGSNTFCIGSFCFCGRSIVRTGTDFVAHLCTQKL